MPKSENIIKKSLSVTALGGLHEIGKNMYLVEAHEPQKEIQRLILDAGILYPGLDSPGVDYTMADFNFLAKKFASIEALVLTSVHEAHCGGAHHFITKSHIKKVIGSKLAIAKTKQELSEDLVASIEWTEFQSREEISCGNFKIIPFRISSSSPESYAVAIEAQDQKLFYSGSFKLDQCLKENEKTDIFAISEYASNYYDNNDAIDLFLGDSANVEKPGYSISEEYLKGKFKELLAKNQTRVIINTYNSNLIRIQNLFEIAENSGRKVALLNKEARKAYQAAEAIGFWEHKKETLISVKEINDFRDNEILIISTAPEGEALRELEKIAYDKSLEIQLKEGDVVINSADLPPGTVRVMAQISDQFFLKGVKIIGGANAGVHAESHALIEELKFMFNLLRPKYFVPAMGETRHLIRHAKLAVDSGVDPGSILILDNGDKLNLHNPDAEVMGHEKINEILFNDAQDFQVDNKLIKERESLAADGVVIVSFSLNKKRKVVTGPAFSAKACTFSNNKDWRAFCLMNSQDIIDEVESLGEEQPNASIEDFQSLVRENLNRLIKVQIGKKPSVIVLANEVLS